MTEYSIHELNERHELDAVVDLIWRAQYAPYFSFVQMLFPTFGYSDEDRARAIISSKERLWNELISDNSGHQGWIYVRHKGGEIVAGAQWDWHEGSPFPNGCPKLDFYWWPEGEAKEFCQEMLQQAYTPRSLWMQREHGGLNNMVVHPKYRGRGIGGLIISWYNERLDMRGIEGFLEASELGRRCYQQHGYQVVMKLDFFVPAGKSDLWQRFAHEMKPGPWYAMWRPIRGGPDPNGRTKPWQLGVPVPV